MSASLRCLPFLSLICLFLAAFPLKAQDPLPPPLPKPTAANAQLEGLRTMAGAGTTASPRTPVVPPSEPVTQDLPATKPIRQTAFTTVPINASEPELPTEPSFAEPPENPFWENSLDEEPKDAFNPMLDKQLDSKKRTKKNDLPDDGESDGSWTNKLAKPELTPLFSVGGSLFIVIAAFFLLVILFRKVSPKGNLPLPKEAFECLGRYFLTQKHQLQVLRLGNRIVLVSVMPDEVSTLAEISNPDEVVSFLGLCRRLDNHSATEMFRKTVSGMSEDELSRSHDRPTVMRQRPSSPATLDLYSSPDESLATILARGRYR